MNWLRNLSLKFKLVLLLILLTGTMLSVYAFLALRDFERDKIAYVLDSSLGQTRAAALQMRTELTYFTERTRFLLRGYDSSNKKFHPYSGRIFSGEQNFLALISFQPQAVGGAYELADVLKKDSVSADDVLKLKTFAQQLTAAADHNEIAISRSQAMTEAFTGHDSLWLLGVKYETQGQTPIIAIAAFEGGEFLKIFDSPQMQDLYLVDKHAELIFSPVNSIYQASPESTAAAFTEANTALQSPEGVFQYRENKKSTWLVAAASVGIGGLRVMGLIPKTAALETVRLVMIKSAIFLVFLFFITIILAVLSSLTLTASLKKLIAAAADIGRGNFGVKVAVRGRDEIGTLATGFNQMASEIERLLGETAEKARMQNELETAQLVQSTLFPADNYDDDVVVICGHYEPASECSGDWWYYRRLVGKTIFCIGDATGHGVSAALLTAAARGVATTLEIYPELPLHEMMRIFNAAIYNTSKGKVMMTFFLGAIDHQTGTLTYSNASHEPPLVLPAREVLQKRDIGFLGEAVSSRLGENPEAIYKTATHEFAPGDRIVLYTDGVTELKNLEGKMWGERAFIKSLLQSANLKGPLPSCVQQINQELATFRATAPLADDVTYFMLERKVS